MESSAQVPEPLDKALPASAPPAPALSSQNPATEPTPVPEPGLPSVMLRDGGGVVSTADWFQPQEADLGSEIRQQWWQRIQDWDLVRRLDAHVQSRARIPWLNDGEVQMLRSDLAFFLKRQGVAASTEICDGQPLCLSLLQGCLELWDDLDVALPGLLAEGVPTGVLEAIEPSGVWRALRNAPRSICTFGKSRGAQV